MTLMFRLNDGDEHDGSTLSDATNAAHVSRHDDGQEEMIDL
jgi:hypothetical protein